MGSLSGFSYRDITRKLKKSGFLLDRTTKSSHEIWYNNVSKKRTTVSNHPGDIPEGTVRAIVRQIGITSKEFLNI